MRLRPLRWSTAPLVAAALLVAATEMATARAAAEPAAIEGLETPRPAPPPRPKGDPGESDLDRKRQERERRDRELAPKPEPFVKRRQEQLRKEALTPRPHQLLVESALVFGAATTSGAREGYTLDPNVHLAAFWRHGGRSSDGRAGLWYGARIAPFNGSGFHDERPGAYGLTYFGPMIGIGKIDPVPEDDGTPQAADAARELDIPSADGWLFAMGLAAVSKMSRSEDKEADDPANDFVSKGATFDGPGAWIESRYLKILFGGLGLDAVVGAQSGRGKVFVYGGVGLGFWY